LAFTKDITQKNPFHPDESKNPDLKNYMDYQRKLNHVRIVYYSLKSAKGHLEENLLAARKNGKNPDENLQRAFPISHHFANPKTLLLMLKKLIGGHNETKQWYRMNAYYYALVYDCMNQFIADYNQMVRNSAEGLEEYDFARGVEIDFGDWSYMFFPDLDFHIGSGLGYTHYPFAKRNKSIEDQIDQKTQSGQTMEQSLKAIKETYEIDNISIKVLLHKKISHEDLELFHTSMKNPIYELLTQKQKGSWDAMDGESLMDQAYNLGSQMKVWTWAKKKRKVEESI